jgi:hypothetical protein
MLLQIKKQYSKGTEYKGDITYRIPHLEFKPDPL